MGNDKAPRRTDKSGRLPSAWYKEAEDIADAARKERIALMIRGAAAVCYDGQDLREAYAAGRALLEATQAARGRPATDPVS